VINGSSVALGVPVFQRTKKLHALLKSVDPTPIDRVYVADNGHTEERNEVYNADWMFDLTVLDVAYDSGLGNCRSRIVKELEEDFLVITDSDHRVPASITILIEQLQAQQNVGGICGLLLEHGGLRGTCHDLYEDGDILIRDIRGKEAKIVAGSPFLKFDFLQNVAAFRRECVEDYHWDPNLKQGKPHLDFYVGHKRQTDWQFGLCPEVQFPHYPGGTSDYSSRRNRRERLIEARKHFLNKWGYRQIVYGQVEWLETQDRVLSEKDTLELLAKSVITRLPTRMQVRITDLRLLIRRLKGEGPL